MSEKSGIVSEGTTASAAGGGEGDRHDLDKSQRCARKGKVAGSRSVRARDAPRQSAKSPRPTASLPPREISHAPPAVARHSAVEMACARQVGPADSPTPGAQQPPAWLPPEGAVAGSGEGTEVIG